MKPPDAVLGRDALPRDHHYQIDPEYMILPGPAIFLTVLAFNLFGDGLRDAFDPKGSR